MHADELRMAVTKVVDILEKADIRSVVNQYRGARGEQRTAAAARLGHAGAVIMERLDGLSAAERQVTRVLHLDSLGQADYWQELLGSVNDPTKHQAAIVHLASRVMFATSHLPNLASLLYSVQATASANPAGDKLEPGEGGLKIRLTDAGERASDPDRLARAIDGIDMLYSACASIARKPAIDLRLDELKALKNRDREIRFTGERDSVAAVFAVIDSIPDALAEIDPEQDIDLDAVVQSLPIFEDLNTLASLGTFSKKDLKDITDTMHQGALLALESGVILVETADPADTLALSANDGNVRAAQARVNGSGAAHGTPANADSGSGVAEQTPAARDEHYDRYLREREAMLRPQQDSGPGNGRTATDTADDFHVPTELDNARADQKRRAAVDELLKSLGQSRSS